MAENFNGANPTLQRQISVLSLSASGNLSFA